MFKKWHVDNKVLEKLLAKNNNTIKVVAGAESHGDHKNPKNGAFKYN
jgi:hypothetical protein